MVVSNHGTAMHTTSTSLLMRLRQPEQAEAWARFVRLYSPMVYDWARRLGLQDADAGDLVQEVFTALVQKLPEFSYDEHQHFRGWLWVVTRNKLRDLRSRRPLPIDRSKNADEVTAPTSEGLEEAEFRSHLLARLVSTYQDRFHPTTWKAFWEQVVNGKRAAQVAQELGVTRSTASKAKIHVLACLHKELEDLME